MPTGIRGDGELSSPVAKRISPSTYRSWFMDHDYLVFPNSCLASVFPRLPPEPWSCSKTSCRWGSVSCPVGSNDLSSSSGCPCVCVSPSPSVSPCLERPARGCPLRRQRSLESHQEFPRSRANSKLPILRFQRLETSTTTSNRICTGFRGCLFGGSLTLVRRRLFDCAVLLLAVPGHPCGQWRDGSFVFGRAAVKSQQS